MKRKKKQLVWASAALLSAAALAVVSCNWHLKTRTPALNDRQVAPAFSLPDHTGKQMTLEDLTAKGPAIVVFYRGYW